MIYKVFVLLPTIVVSDGIVGIAWLGKVFSWRYGKNKKKNKNVSLMIGYNTGMSLKSKIDDNAADDYLRRIAEENRI